MKKSLFAVLAIVGLVLSCDKDYNTIGSELVGEGDYDFEMYSVENIKAYSKATGPVQSNNLPVNSLGVYNNPYFGTTVASFVSQIELERANPTIGYNPEVDSVYLYVPYFYEPDFITNSDGSREFVLDSVFNYNENQTFNLELFVNGYELNDFDPNENYEIAQKYYNDQNSDIENNKGVLLNTSLNTSQNTNFFVNDDEIIIYETNGFGLYVDEDGEVLTDQSDVENRIVKTRKTPGVWLDLNSQFFEDNILSEAENGVFFNNNVFKSFFKGLYFKVSENSPGEGSLALLDFSKAEFKILYKASVVEPSAEEPNPEKTRRELVFRMGYDSSGTTTCNSINLLEYNHSTNYSNELVDMNGNNEDLINGDERIFIKGGEGSVAFIDLFGDVDIESINEDGELVVGSNGVPDELDRLRTYGWLINEARLTFTIDQNNPDGMGNTNQQEPFRVYVFDATNEKPIFDYYADGSTSSNPKLNKRSFGGIIEKDAFNKGVRYRVRITEYINRLIKNENDNQNVRLGVCVTESINLSANSYLRNPISLFSNSVENQFVPTANVMNPLGTVLYGTDIPTGHPDFEKRLKLEIYYTKPN